LPQYAYRRHVRWLHIGKGPIKEARVATRTAEPKPNLSTMKKADLVALAEEKAVDSTGTRADIIERLSDG